MLTGVFKLKTGCFHKAVDTGFTLIELLIVIAILAIVAAFGIPSFKAWAADTKTRTVAEAIQNGLRLAQVEAVKRGVQVQFVLTDDTPTAKDVTESTTGKSWVIQTMDRAIPANTDEFVEGASVGDVNGASLISADPAASLTFNSLGRVVSPSKEMVYTITHPDGERTLKVMVSKSGKVRMCDADVTLATSPLGCP